MRRRIQCLGIALLAAIALSAVGAATASAFLSGHFVSEDDHTELKGVEAGAERTEFRLASFAAYQCEETTYAATVTNTTVQEITVFPLYAKCVRTVEGAEDEKVEVKTNGCHFLMTIGPESEEVHSTAHLKCPTGKKSKSAQAFARSRWHRST